MNVRLLTEHHLEFLCFKGGCTGLSETTHVKMPHCWKSHALAQLLLSHSEYSNDLITAPLSSTLAAGNLISGFQTR